MTVACTGAVSYQFPFIGVASTDITVLYTPVNGAVTTVSHTAYTVSLNAPVTGEIWGVGGTVNPVTPANYASGSLTITRTLPFTQTAQIGNQGNQYAIVTEEALDVLCMEIQQVAARTGSYRGVWIAGTVYNFGDIVQDGVNGAYTNNIYVCANANTSGVWATDLAAGDWVLSISVASLQPPGSFLPLTGGTVTGNLSVTGTSTLATLAVTGHSTLEGVTSTGATGTGKLVYATAPTVSALTVSDLTASQLVATNASKVLVSVTALPSGTTATTGTSGSNNTALATNAYADARQLNKAFLTSGTSWTSPSNITASTVFKITLIGGGGGCASNGGAIAGGAGAQVYWWQSGLTASTAYAYAIGAGGSNTGGTGGATNITIGTTPSAGGGVGSGTGTGGAASGGTINVPGQNGTGSAGSSAGTGGSTPYGGGSSYSTTSGNPAVGYGAGAGGEAAQAGTQGMILIEWVA